MRIMNIKYILLGFAVLLTACSSDNDEFNITNANRTQLAISTEIVTTRAEFYTGLKNDVEFRNGNQIGFTLVDVNYKKPIYEQDCNIKAVYNNGQWEQERTTTLSNKEGKVIAYYPYGTGYKFIVSGGAPGPTIGQHFIPVDISSFFHGDGQQEYLCGESNIVSSVSPNARIKFRHVLPRITFVIEKGSANANDEIYLRSAVLKNANDADNTICTKGTMNIESGYLSKNDDGGSSITNSYLGAVPLDPTDEQLTFDFLVFPTEVVQGSVILRIEVRKGTAGNFQYYDIPIPATKWESGKQYTYPVTLNIKESQQETKETPGEKVYMGFNGDNGKPLYWSSWNLGASKPEDYGGLYGWGDPTGEHKEHYYEYKKDDPYYMTDTLKCLSYYGGSNPPSNISGTSYDVARQKWGRNWRIPTNNEFNLLDENCTCVWTTQNGVKGMLFTSKVNKNTIFMPYSPSRYGNYLYFSGWNTVSGTYYEGMDYWCANLNSTEKFRASIFVINNSNSCWIGRGGKRYQGLPIRPVTE